MEKGYPFSGTGNLFRFLQGLISISIQNNVVVIYDNDAEGIANYERSCALNVPTNMLILKLPNSRDFAEFDTIGPNGRQIADINGCAAASIIGFRRSGPSLASSNRLPRSSVALALRIGSGAVFPILLVAPSPDSPLDRVAFRSLSLDHSSRRATPMIWHAVVAPAAGRA
jgi:hypothetical protein